MIFCCAREEHESILLLKYSTEQRQQSRRRNFIKSNLCMKASLRENERSFYVDLCRKNLSFTRLRGKLFKGEKKQTSQSASNFFHETAFAYENSARWSFPCSWAFATLSMTTEFQRASWNFIILIATLGISSYRGLHFNETFVGVELFKVFFILGTHYIFKLLMFPIIRSTFG